MPVTASIHKKKKKKNQTHGVVDSHVLNIRDKHQNSEQIENIKHIY